MSTIREAVGPAEAFFVLDNASRGGPVVFTSVPSAPEEAKVVRLPRRPSFPAHS